MLCYDITATAPATKNIEDAMVRLCKLSCATIITVARGWQIIYPIGVPLSPLSRSSIHGNQRRTN